ncbi:hypothetical protein AVEN_104044-1 [Araneus ventricosus]|uniref:Retrovirus-related Pol polyprotein from transposon TNT 1-94-like beta-barrel domain-containing protein n=1 Tax=Araneus ventricosus TaxID=182803 RepID=A0A4Y2LNU9_ARAVE|nr:hypothetical protein AVEN_104044-1 [Araneus ventricosus]
MCLCCPFVGKSVCVAETDLTYFWIDNEATRHIAKCPEYFIDYTSFHSPCGIKTPGKETLAEIRKGTICVKITVGEKCQDIMLRDVWYVAEISRNLFSVSIAQDRNTNSEFKSSSIAGPALSRLLQMGPRASVLQRM